MNKEFDIVELDNGLKFVVIDAINYNGRTFVLLGKLNETLDDVVGDLSVYEKKEDKITVIEDNELLDKLVKTFEKRVHNS